MPPDAAIAFPASEAAVRRATLVGSGAIGLWSTLALATTLTGAVPPFLMVGLTFTVAALLMAAKWIAAGEPILAKLVWPARVWALGVYGLFGYHALYFLALKTAPAVEANLVNYLWPLLIVLFSALLPGERLRWFHVAGAALGLAGAAILTLGGGITGAMLAKLAIEGSGFNFGGFLPPMSVYWSTVFLGVSIALVVGAVSGLIPAWQASKLRIVDALRRVD
jgi:drug/metabolite transporter (DMT)-like permease